jgi:Uma2 family endonuclease
MPAATVEHPCDDEPTLLEEAERLANALSPGYRVEIIEGQIHVTPPRNGPHAEAVTDVALSFAALHSGQTKVLPGVGLWLNTGPFDHVVPDLAVVDADYRDHLIESGCYDPAVFRLVVEVTSSNHKADLKTKVGVYANAKIPVYVIVDRKNQRLHLLTEPMDNDYGSHRVFAAGGGLTLPASVGTEVELDVETILAAGRR